MKRILLLVVAMTMVYINSSAQQNLFHLKGAVDSSFNGKLIMLFTFTSSDIDKVHRVDTTIVNNGMFYFEGQPYVNNFSLVSVGNYPEPVLTGEVVLESGYITIKLDSVCHIRGTNLNDLYQQYKDSCKYIRNLYKDDVNIAISKEFAYKLPFLKENIQNAIGRTIFMQETYNFVTFDNFNPIYELADDTLKQQEKIIEALEYYKKKVKADNRWTSLIGQPYQSFSFTSMDGKEENLSDYIGKSKYLIIDIWASWCAPCRAEMPAWKEFIVKYKDSGFTILGISIDESQKAWKSAVERLDMPWEQAICGKDNTVLKDFYKVLGIPHTILINQEGKILGSKFNAHSLEQHIENGFLK